MNVASVRRHALSLPEVTESPHHHLDSFRVRGKIFMTVPPERTHLHLFVSQSDRERALAMHPECTEKLLWGGKVVGVRVALASATVAFVKLSIRQAWQAKAPKALLAAAGEASATPTSPSGTITNVNVNDANADTAARIATFLARYSPAIELQLTDARRRLRAFCPRGFELVFDNYNALVFAISPTERSADAFLSIAGYPKWVTLFFLNGSSLDDPLALLEGRGKQIRSIRLVNPAQIDTPDVEALIAQALRSREAALQAAPPLATVIKMVVATQRPRRPATR